MSSIMGALHQTLIAVASLLMAGNTTFEKIAL